MRQVESCLGIKSEKAERSPFVPGYTQRDNAEINKRGASGQAISF